MEPNVEAGVVNVCEMCPENGSKCTETNALEIFEISNEYHRKLLRDIDKNGGQGDVDDLKLQIYNDWIAKVCDMHVELIATLSELEDDCSNKLKKLKRTHEKNLIKFGKRLGNLEKDKSSLIQLIKRTIKYQKWDIRDLEFHDILLKDIFGNDLISPIENDSVCLDIHVTSSSYHIENLQVEDLIGQLDQKNSVIKDLYNQLEQLKQMFSVDDENKNVDLKAFDVLDDIYEQNSILLGQLKNVTEAKSHEMSTKLEENEELKKEVEALKEDMKKNKSELDSRVLVSEISEHFDKCRKLEHKLKSSQEKLRQADITISYKSSVVSELRKENKRLNQSDNPSEKLSNTSSDNFLSANSSPIILSTELEKVTEASNLEVSYVKILKSEFEKFMEQMKDQELNLKDLTTSNENSVAKNNTLNHQQQKELENNKLKLDLMEHELINMISCYIPSLDASQHIIHCMNVINDGLKKSVTSGDIENFPRENVLFAAFRQVFNTFEDDLKKTKKDNDDLLNKISRLKEQIDKLHQKQDEYGSKLTEYDSERKHKIEAELLMNNEMRFKTHLEEKQTFLEKVLFDLYKEITFMIGKDVSDDSITSSLSDMDVVPLQNLIRDLKKEISSKDCVLQSKKIELSKYEEEICAKNKDLTECHRKLATLVKDNKNYFQMIDNLRQTLGLHDETIRTLKDKNNELQQQYEDMKFTLLDYRENVHSILEEKAKLEEECKNQLLTISNLRLALENALRVTTNSSFFSFW